MCVCVRGGRVCKEVVSRAGCQIILILPFGAVTAGLGGGYVRLFLSFHIHAGLRCCNSKGLNGASTCLSVYRGEAVAAS